MRFKMSKLGLVEFSSNFNTPARKFLVCLKDLDRLVQVCLVEQNSAEQWPSMRRIGHLL